MKQKIIFITRACFASLKWNAKINHMMEIVSCTSLLFNHSKKESPMPPESYR